MYKRQDEGREDLLRQTLRRKKARLWAALSPQQHPHQNGGHCVDEVQSPAGCQTLKAAQAHYAQNEGWPCVITEGEQALRLAAGDAALSVQLTHGAPAHGVAPQKAQEKGRGPGPAYPEQQRRCRGQAAAHPLGTAQGLSLIHISVPPRHYSTVHVVQYPPVRVVHLPAPATCQARPL